MTPAITIHDFRDDLAPHFARINTQWLEAMYRIEPTDRAVLDHPRAHIVDPGGAILFAEVDGLGIVGTCALQPSAPGRIELTKMGVLDIARGRGVGAVLLNAVIARADKMGAGLLYLLSNRRSASAIRLYERAGFVHDAGIMADHGARYERCDVAMRYAGSLASRSVLSKS